MVGREKWLCTRISFKFLDLRHTTVGLSLSINLRSSSLKLPPYQPFWTCLCPTYTVAFLSGKQHHFSA
ncbi:hypothetical protein FKM82_023000 [Ascaphus truei]